MRTPDLLVALALVAALPSVACTSEAPADPTDLLGCGANPDPHCDHPIDRLVLPRLRALGLEPRQASPAEYCRRLAIDLWGRIPNPAELAACIEMPDAATRADAFMNAPLYLRTMRRAWGELLAYDNFRGWTEESLDLDELVRQLYAEELDYASFATTVAVHPGFLGLHPGDEWAAGLWTTFLGRPARADEIAGFRPLANVWMPRFFCEGHIYWTVYRELTQEEGFTHAEAATATEDTCGDLYRTEWATNFCLCLPGYSAGGCSSDVLGTPIDLSGPCADEDEPYETVNLSRIDPRLPGDDDTCPDGVRRPECLDLEIFYDDFGMRPLVALPLLDDAGRAELSKIGTALVARGDFWEAAVDHEARLLLGWWQTSFRRPESDLPEVRRFLADHLRETGSVRDVQRLLLTSLLYTAPAEPPAGVTREIPDFAMAPTKLMAAETWLDSAAAVVDERSGVCDFRFVTPEGYYDTSMLDLRVADYADDSIYDLHASEDVEDGYATAAIRLGGCNAETRRPALSNVGMAFAEGELTRMLCAYGRGVLPDGWDGTDLDAGARHVVRAALGRELDDAEAAELTGEMRECLAAGPDHGCADPETAVRWLCQRALESTEFSTY
jgi:hypothetical protein